MEKGAEASKQQADDGDIGADADNVEDPVEEQAEGSDYVPPPDEDTMSILSIIPNDHDRIKGLYRRYKDPTDSKDQRQLLAHQLLQELHTHMMAEEQVVYPVVADEIDEHMRDHAVDEHDSLKLFSSDLEGQTVDDEGFEDKMHQLMETFLEHIHEEEHKMLHALRDTLDEPALRELGKSFEAAKQQMPASRGTPAADATAIKGVEQPTTEGVPAPAGAVA